MLLHCHRGGPIVKLPNMASDQNLLRSADSYFEPLFVSIAACCNLSATMLAQALKKSDRQKSEKKTICNNLSSGFRSDRTRLFSGLELDRVPGSARRPGLHKGLWTAYFVGPEYA